MWQNMPYGHGDGYGWMHGGGGWLEMGLQGLLWILVFVALVGIIAWAVRARSEPRPYKAGGEGRTNAMEILDERYARGEIDREDYMARKAHLEDR